MHVRSVDGHGAFRHLGAVAEIFQTGREGGGGGVSNCVKVIVLLFSSPL